MVVVGADSRSGPSVLAADVYGGGSFQPPSNDADANDLPVVHDVHRCSHPYKGWV